MCLQPNGYYIFILTMIIRVFSGHFLFGFKNKSDVTCLSVSFRGAGMFIFLLLDKVSPPIPVFVLI